MEARGDYQRRRVGIGVVAAAVFLAAVVGVAALLDLGPFSDSSGSGGEPLTKDEFLTQGDAICTDAQRQYAEAEKDIPETTAQDAAQLTQRLVDISRSELAQIRALNGPASVRAELERYLKAREQGISLLERALSAAQDSNVQAYQQAKAQLFQTQPTRTQLANAVGFKECSQQFSSSESSG